MGQVCTICSHPDRLQIDRDIVNSVPHLRIAKNYGLTDTAVRNHAQNHLTRQMLKSHEIAERANAAVLLDEIDTCMTKAKNILKQAEDNKQPSLQLAALREIRQTIEFLSKLAISLAELQQQRELAGMVGTGQRTVVVLPAKINPGMTATEAGQIYKDFLKATGEHPGAEFQFHEDQSHVQEQEQSESDRPMIRKRRPSSATRIKASASTGDPDRVELELSPAPDQDQEDDDLDGMVGPSILSWQPTIPKRRSTWGR